MNIFKRIEKLEFDLETIKIGMNQLNCEHPLNRLYFKTYNAIGTSFSGNEAIPRPYRYACVCQDCGKIIESSIDKDNIKEWHKKKNDYMADYHMKIAENYKNGKFDD